MIALAGLLACLLLAVLAGCKLEPRPIEPTPDADNETTTERFDPLPGERSIVVRRE